MNNRRRNPVVSAPRIALFFTAVAMSLARFPGSAAAQPLETAKSLFYVSPRGNDQWSGRLPAADREPQDGPFATLTAARNAIRRLKSENRLPGAVDVMVLEGTYHLAEPFVLTAEDTGNEKHPVTYSAYPGHHPVLSGGKVIDDWKPSQGKIVETHLPGGRRRERGSSVRSSSAGSVKPGPAGRIPILPTRSTAAGRSSNRRHRRRRASRIRIATPPSSRRGSGRIPSRRRSTCSPGIAG